MAKDITVEWGITGCSRYRECNGPERCPMLTSIDYLMQEHGVAHCCDLKYRIDASRREDRPYCSFVLVMGGDQPDAEGLKMELELATGLRRPEEAP